MNIQNLCISTGLAVSAGLTASAAETLPVSHPPDASIPFANHGGIYNWQADRDRGLWVQDIHRNWYYAKLMGPCWGLDFAEGIGFDTRPVGTFDRFSAVIVPRGGRCVVQSFTRSVGPLAKRAAKAALDTQKHDE